MNKKSRLDKKFFILIGLFILMFFVLRNWYYHKLAEVSTFRMDDEFNMNAEGTGPKEQNGAVEMVVKGLEDSEEKELFKNVIIPTESVGIFGASSEKTKFRYVEITNGAFENNAHMEYIFIPKTMEKIGLNAFRSCKKLKKVSYEGTKEEWNKIKILEGNDELINAEIKYKQSIPKVMDYLH